MISRRLLRCGVALLAGLALLLPPTLAQAAPQQLVALGDSYSAGVGTRDKKNDCYQSPAGYPVLLAQRGGYRLNYQACIGATTADVTNNQLAALAPTTAAVTMTIGGNDVGFAKVLTECAKPGWMSDCEGAIAGGRAILERQLPGRYDRLFAAIRNRAPKATVVIASYPRLFNGEDCNIATFFSPKEQAALNAATNDLARLIQSKSAANQFRYADPRRAFTNRAVCDDVEWVNGLSWPVEESYHPNRAGSLAYADLMGPALGIPNRKSSRPAEASAAQTEQPKATARAEADRVLELNLDSTENLKRAADNGVDPDAIRDLVKRLRSRDDTTVRQALADLRKLEAQTS